MSYISEDGICLVCGRSLIKITDPSRVIHSLVGYVVTSDDPPCPLVELKTVNGMTFNNHNSLPVSYFLPKQERP